MIHLVSLKGRRDENQDKHNVVINNDNKFDNMAMSNLYGIYDGHGGKFVSAFLSKNLPNLFLDKNLQYPLKRKTILEKYNELNSKLKNNYYEMARQTGSTCLVVLQYKSECNDYINVINTGDSRCILCRDNLAIPLTKDHKPNWPEERSRIVKIGGKIYFDGDDYRIKDLSVSRAFGDYDATPFLTYVPDIYRYKLEGGDKFIVMACDGVWDVLSNQDVVNFILTECFDVTTEKRNGNSDDAGNNVATKLGEYAISKGSGDNITIIVIFLR